MRPTLEQIEEKHKVKITGTTLKNMPFDVLKGIVKDLGMKHIAVKREVCETNVAAFFQIELDAPAIVVPAPEKEEKQAPPLISSNDEDEVKSVEQARKSTDFFMLKRFLLKHNRYKPGMNLVECRSASVKLFNDLTGVAPQNQITIPGKKEVAETKESVEKRVETHKAKTEEVVKKVVKKVEAKKPPINKVTKEAEKKTEPPKQKKEIIIKDNSKLSLVNGVKYGHQPNGVICEEKLNELTTTKEEKAIFERKDIRDSDKVRLLVNLGSKLKIQEIAGVLIRSYAMVYEIRKKFILGKNKKETLKYTGKTFTSESAKEIKEIRIKSKEVQK